jgi:dihydropteroate synthase
MVRLISQDVDLKELLTNIGSDMASYPIFLEKDKHLRVWIDDVYFAAASVIKQESISCGADAAVHKQVITGRVERSSVLIFATVRQLKCIAEKLSRMPYWGLRDLSKNISSLVEYAFRKRFKLKMPHGELSLNGTKVMTILNVTPDSFYPSSRVNTDSAIARAVEAEKDGAAFVDIGGESTRPGAAPVTEEEELNRVLPVVEKVRTGSNLFISVDTYRSKVAKKALDAGADLINDIYGLQKDPDMAKIIADYGIPVVIMHMRGTPATMQNYADYDDVMKEIMEYFEERIDYALRSGIDERQIILDPGIGFAKLPKHNLEIMKRVEDLFSLGFPLLVGHSRKSTLGKVLGDVPPDDRLFGTVAWTSYLAWKGVHIVRVHDTKPNVDAVKAVSAIREGLTE